MFSLCMALFFAPTLGKVKYKCGHCMDTAIEVTRLVDAPDTRILFMRPRKKTFSNGWSWHAVAYLNGIVLDPEDQSPISTYDSYVARKEQMLVHFENPVAVMSDPNYWVNVLFDEDKIWVRAN